MDEEINKIQIGKSLSQISSICYIFGILFNFHKGILIISNIIFFIGIYLIIGKEKIIKLFIKNETINGSILLFLGLFFLILGFGFIGSFLQIIGFYIVFGSFFPIVIGYIRRTPIIGPFIIEYIDKFGYKKDEEENEI